jgi:hypothetical protein
MRERILDECSKRGTCLLNRQQFDETFTGHDLTIQVRSAIDFAQQNGLAFGRSTGDQHFIFSRLAKDSVDPQQQQRRPQGSAARRRHRPRPKGKGNPKRNGAAHRPFGRTW